MTSQELRQLQRMLRDPFNYPPELWAWIKARIENDSPALDADAIVGFDKAVQKAGGTSWTTGDTKISAQTASHKDGTQWWLLADGSAIPAEHTDLRALLGPNVPDAKGRALVMMGTHADVNAIGKSEGQPLGNRRPAHGTTIYANPNIQAAPAGHVHNLGTVWDNYAEPGSKLATDAAYSGGPEGGAGPAVWGGQYGPAGAQMDQPAFTVVGNLFYHT